MTNMAISTNAPSFILYGSNGQSLESRNVRVTDMDVKNIRKTGQTTIRSQPSFPPLADKLKCSSEAYTDCKNVGDIDVTMAVTPLVGQDATSSLGSLEIADRSLREANEKGVQPDKSEHVKKSLLTHFHNGSFKAAFKQAYKALPSGVVPKVIATVLASLGFIAGTVACAATGGTLPLIATTVFAGISAIIGAGDAIRAYQTRHHKQKPFANDCLGHLIYNLSGRRHKKVANGFSSGIRISLFCGSIIALAGSSAVAGASAGHSAASGSSVIEHSAPHWTHVADVTSVAGEASLVKVEYQQLESNYNLHGHALSTVNFDEIGESTNL